jgi:hypothetical protein
MVVIFPLLIPVIESISSLMQIFGEWQVRYPGLASLEIKSKGHPFAFSIQ